MVVFSVFKIFDLKKFISLFSVAAIAVIILGAFHIGNSVVYANAEQKHEQYTVYFTFDDGPSAVTKDLLDVLAKEDVKATFFVIGSTTENGIDLYNRIINDGHALGLHTFSHDTSKIYKSPEAFMEDFNKLEDWIFNHTNTASSIYRFPGGSKTVNCSENVMNDIQKILSDDGYVMYDWNVQANDCSDFTLDQKTLVSNVINGAKNKPNQDLIILFHDDGLRTSLPGAMKDIINYFRSEGYGFDILTENTVLK